MAAAGPEPFLLAPARAALGPVVDALRLLESDAHPSGHIQETLIPLPESPGALRADARDYARGLGGAPRALAGLLSKGRRENGKVVEDLAASGRTTVHQSALCLPVGLLLSWETRCWQADSAAELHVPGVQQQVAPGAGARTGVAADVRAQELQPRGAGIFLESEAVVALPTECLLNLGMCAGMLASLSNPASRKRCAARTIVLATSVTVDSLASSSDATASGVAAGQHSVPLSLCGVPLAYINSAGQCARLASQGPIVYLTPILAFNLGLNLELLPFLPPPPSYAPQKVRVEPLLGGMWQSPRADDQARGTLQDEVGEPVAWATHIRLAQVRTPVAVPAWEGGKALPQRQGHGAKGGRDMDEGAVQAGDVRRHKGRQAGGGMMLGRGIWHDGSVDTNEEDGWETSEGEEDGERDEEGTSWDEAAAEQEERQQRVDKALRSYFLQERIVNTGDCFSLVVELRNQGETLHLSANSSRDFQPQLLHFKVVSLEPQGRGPLKADHNRAQIILTPAISSRVPPLLPRHSCAVPTWRSCPALHGQHFMQLASILAAPLLSPVVGTPIVSSLLLAGPAGAGKSSAVRAACASLGIQCVQFWGHDLVGSSDKASARALVSAFSAARRYSPAVLLIRKLDVLAKLSSEVGQGPGPQSNTGSDGSSLSPLAQCLAACMRGELPDAQSRWDAFAPKATGGAWHTGDPEVPEDGAAIPLVLVACADSLDSVPLSLRRHFRHEISLPAPDEAQRVDILHHLMCHSLPHSAALAAAPPPSVPHHPGFHFLFGHQHEQPCKGGSSLGHNGEDPSWMACGSKHPCPRSDEILALARRTAGLQARDLRALVADAAAQAIVHNFPQTPKRVEARGSAAPSVPLMANPSSAKPQQGQGAIQIRGEHMEESMGRVKKRTEQIVGALNIPNVKWEDVGGLEDVKAAILDTVQLPLRHKELFASGLRQRSGVLLYGPPGTGKTLLAKAVATECSLNFLSVKGPELINMYIGESERNVREVFAKARAAKPCVVFFDELDALAPARGAAGDSGGVMDRVVSQLLAEVDGMGMPGAASASDIFLIGASNRPDLIDPALLRPGRFDKLLYVGISSDAKHRARVLKALTRKFCLAPTVRLDDLASACQPTYTGADLYALCADAWLNAAKRQMGTAAASSGTVVHHDSSLPKGGHQSSAGDEKSSAVEVQQEDFLQALKKLTPSLSAAELARYERLRNQLQGQAASG